MTTKESVLLLLKQKQDNIIPDNFNDNFFNLSLNQNLKLSSNAFSKHPKSVASVDERQHLDYDFTNDSQTKKESHSWNKPTNNLTLNFANNSCEKEDKLKKENALSASTLSLHIEAYENSNGANICVVTKENLKKNFLIKNAKQIDFDSTAVIQKTFEFPRQQENGEAVNPEIAQYRASQQLLNPNQSTALTDAPLLNGSRSPVRPQMPTASSNNQFLIPTAGVSQRLVQIPGHGSSTMNTSYPGTERAEDVQPSTSSDIDTPSSSPPKTATKSRHSGVSEFYTSTYVKLTKENIEQMKLSKDSFKKYYFFDEKDKLQVYQLIDPAVIENFYKTEQDFTLEEGLLVFLAAERFNDPAMAKLDGRTKEECVQIFTKIISNPAIFEALQNSFCNMNSNQMHKLMFTLPFTEVEDAVIKKLDGKQPPTQEELHKIQKEGFTYFRGRRAIASRYSQIWANKELDEHKYENMTLLQENNIMPFHDKFSAATLKYLTACSVPELNDSLHFMKNVAYLSDLHSSNDIRIFGNLTLYGQTYEMCNEKNFVYFSNGKLNFQPGLTKRVTYCNNICIKISNTNITFFNAFGVAIIINGVTFLTGHKAVFPHKGTFVVNIPNFDVFYYKTVLSNVPDIIIKTPVKHSDHILMENGEINNENVDSETFSTMKKQLTSSPTVANESVNAEINGMIPSMSLLSSITPEKRQHDENVENGDKNEPDAKRIRIDETETATKSNDADTNTVKRGDIIEALRNFQQPSDEFDSVPIPYDLRVKATMRSVEGLPTTRPLDDRLLPEFVLYKYLTFNSAKSVAPCDYIVLRRYLKDEMSEKLKLSKFVKADSENLSMVPMLDDLSGSLDYNAQLHSLLTPTHVLPSKYDSDIRFYSNDPNVVIEEEKIEYYGQLRFEPPTLNQMTKKMKNIPPRVKSNLIYNDFKCEFDLLNSFTPGVPKYYPYFPPKPKLVRNEKGHPVWINLPEKPKPEPVKQNRVPPASRIIQPTVSTFRQPNPPSQFCLYSAPRYSSLPRTSYYLHEGTRFRFIPPATSSSQTDTTTSSQDFPMEDGGGPATSTSSQFDF